MYSEGRNWKGGMFLQFRISFFCFQTNEENRIKLSRRMKGAMQRWIAEGVQSSPTKKNLGQPCEQAAGRLLPTLFIYFQLFDLSALRSSRSLFLSFFLVSFFSTSRMIVLPFAICYLLFAIRYSLFELLSSNKQVIYSALFVAPWLMPVQAHSSINIVPETASLGMIEVESCLQRGGALKFLY